MIKLISIADLVSLINAIFGYLAVLVIFLNNVNLSFSFILISLLADGFDGIVARKTGKGELGGYMEAMADMISLSIAPSFFVYIAYNNIANTTIYYHSALIITLIVFLSFSIIRLASFHIIKGKNYFIGLPSSAGTIFIIALSFFKVNFLLILVIILIISLALISPIHFPKIGLKIQFVATILILLTVIMINLFSTFDYNYIFPIILFIAVAIYTFLGPMYIRKTPG
jgi:CDP-diacylglycerol--serine O-phosphatidyltransferase